MNTLPILGDLTLEACERRYHESLTLPSGSATRELRAFEYIAALESALHGSAIAA
jgi:hypothetical protein